MTRNSQISREFNIDDVIDDMILALKTFEGVDWYTLKEHMLSILKIEKKLLADLAALRIIGDLSHEEFVILINDEKPIITSQLMTIRGITMTRVMAEHFTNALIDIYIRSVTDYCRKYGR